MALVSCPDCGKQISDQASACNQCGRPLKADLMGSPSAGSADSVTTGRQRSKLRGDMGQAIAFLGIMVAVFVGMAFGATLGFVTALVFIGLGIYVSYSS